MTKLIGAIIGTQAVCLLFGLFMWLESYTWPAFQLGFGLAQFMWTLPIMLMTCLDVVIEAVKGN